MEVAASCIAFVDFALKLTSAIDKYQKSVRNYPATLDHLRTKLQVAQENAQSIWPVQAGPLQRYNEQLSGLLEDLQKHTEKSGKKWTNRFRRMLWPLSESKFQGYLEVMDSYSKDFSLQDKKYFEVLQWLSTIDFSTRHRQLQDQRQHNTDSPGSVLWLNGIHGSGKSVLMSSIVEDTAAEDQSGNIGRAYLYCHFEKPETTRLNNSGASGVLRSILAQLLSQHMVSKPLNKVLDGMLQKLEKRKKLGEGAPTNLDDLVEMIEQATSSYDKATIIIDALDECDVEVRKALISRLVKLPIDTNGRVRLLLSSRPEHDIRKLLLTAPEQKYRDTIQCIDLAEEEEHSRDVALYVEQSLKEERLEDLTDSLREEISAALLQRATFFQLVRCQLSEILQCETEESIRAALADLPTDLNSTYTRILKKITREERRKIATHTLLWLATAKRALYLEEVAESLRVEPALLPKLLRETAIVEICGSLVIYDEDTKQLSLSHYSVKEFLTSDWLKQNKQGVSGFYVGRALAEETLAIATLAYLARPELRNYDELPEPRPPLLDYSVEYWPEHVKALNLAQARGGSDDIASSIDRVYHYTEQLLLHPDFRGNYRTFYQIRVGNNPEDERQHGISWIFELDRNVHLYGEFDLPPLYYPLYCGLTTTVERFIAQTPSWLDEPVRSCGTPLIIAAGQNDIAMMECLLRLGADINKACTMRGWIKIPPLCYAAFSNNVEATSFLVGNGADVKSVTTTFDNIERALLNYPAYLGNPKIMEMLIELVVQACNEKDKGRLVLDWALQSGSIETVKLVVETGCDMISKTSDGKTALQQALELRTDAIIEYILSKIQQMPDARLAEVLDNVSADELEWGGDKPWHPTLIQLLERSHLPTLLRHSESDVWKVYSILKRSLGLPREVILPIMDHGEHWVKTSVERKEETVVVEYDPDEPYVSLVVSGALRRVVFHTVSHDQGWGGGPEHHGNTKYSNSHTWFEAGVVRKTPGQPSNGQRWASMVVQYNEMKGWFEKVGPADIVGLYPMAKYPGWENHMKEAEMEMWCALV
ncbi:hypothetical protein DFP72DRAFT_930100 [Ephemerocybe angulata]|uniref:NACHT domain-containing protein n=1 Tax=Ephemerocybe angulata TaxID=980116 RepID=A0A8H6HDE1_9AGAR|nr:hypothetical protein DFP72DRAFT_930100 [Tulosesus angulatus]